MTTLPSIFIGHGAPTLAIESSPARNFLRQLGATLPTPKAICCVSAHWETPHPMVNATPQPGTIYDFSGFPATLYHMQYPAPGAPFYAGRVATLLNDAGLACQIDHRRGLDHGTWIPLYIMYPAANIPIFQLTVLAGGSTTDHLALGRLLEPLREEGVLIIGSGNATHNLREFGANALNPTAPAPEWVVAFDDWLRDTLQGGREEELLAYRERAPFAARNHPTEEHFLPLFVALGAGGEGAPVRQLHASFSYGILSMASYAFG